jgi:DNA polymerase-4
VRLIGVAVSGLDTAERQLDLWNNAAAEEARRLQSTLDELRERFGEDIIKKGRDVKRGMRDDR